MVLCSNFDGRASRIVADLELGPFAYEAISSLVGAAKPDPRMHTWLGTTQHRAARDSPHWRSPARGWRFVPKQAQHGSRCCAMAAESTMQTSALWMVHVHQISGRQMTDSVSADAPTNSIEARPRSHHSTAQLGGDVCMALPTLWAMRRWLVDSRCWQGWVPGLLAGCPWPTWSLPKGLRAGAGRLRSSTCRNGISLTNSLSSAARTLAAYAQPAIAAMVAAGY